MIKNFSKLLPYIYSSLLYFIIYTPTVVYPYNKLEITNQFSQLKVSSLDFHINSPTFYLLGFVIDFGKQFNAYVVTLIIINFMIIILITRLTDFLNNYQYLFLASGWLLTSSWWIGYVDSILVLSTILIFKQFNEEKKNDTVLISSIFLLSFSHYVLAFFIILIFIIIFELKRLNLFKILSGYLLGLICNKLLLGYLGYQGVSRARYFINPELNFLARSVESISNNFNIVIFSSLFGMFLLFIIYLFIFQDIKIIVSFSIAIAVTSLNPDTTRIMSILIVPILLKLLADISDNRLEEKINERFLSYLLSFSILTPLIFSNFHVWDNVVYTNSPFVEESNFFQSLIILVNKFFGILT